MNWLSQAQGWGMQTWGETGRCHSNFALHHSRPDPAHTYKNIHIKRGIQRATCFLVPRDLVPQRESLIQNEEAEREMFSLWRAETAWAAPPAAFKCDHLHSCPGHLSSAHVGLDHGHLMTATFRSSAQCRIGLRWSRSLGRLQLRRKAHPHPHGSEEGGRETEKRESEKHRGRKTDVAGGGTSLVFRKQRWQFLHPA